VGESSLALAGKILLDLFGHLVLCINHYLLIIHCTKIQTQSAISGHVPWVPTLEADQWWCKGNLTIEHNTQICARGIQGILDKYNTAEGCIPYKGDPKRKL